jgi:iron complex transport system substrate-binding protein
MSRARSLSALLCLGLSVVGCGTQEPDTVPFVDSAQTSTPSADAGRICTGPATATAPITITPVVTDPKPALPATVTDSFGKQVTVKSADRILALSSTGTLATTVYALGLGKHLVGRDMGTIIPDLVSLPVVVQNGHEINAEAVLGLNPDLVLLDPSIGPHEVKDQLVAAGVHVVNVATEPGAAGIDPGIMAVANAVGLPEAGNQLAARTDNELATVRQKIAAEVPTDPAQRMRMAFLYLRGTAGVYTWLGKGSGADDLINTLNGIDVTTQQGIPSRTPLNAEAVAAANPTLILAMTRGMESVGGVDGMRKVSGLGDTKAGQVGCVVDMNDAQILSFGPMYPATLGALADAVYQRAAPA